ncbi:MAG: PilZ domain-containing protein [Candidatus Omnitrophica bacterium]|nr:PilZ domain-containing protein [Candidatus Omnitrophota bacterium]
MQRKADRNNFGRGATVAEQRKNPRSEEQLVMVCFGYGAAGTAVELLTTNISGGGVAVDVPFDIPAGARVWMEVYVPEDDKAAVIESVYAQGVVVWRRELSGARGSNRCRIGMAFENIPAAAREKISRHVGAECLVN